MKNIFLILFLAFTATCFGQRIEGHRYVSLGAEFAFSNSYVGNAIGIQGAEFLNVSDRFQGGAEAGLFFTSFKNDGELGQDVRLRIRGVFRYLLSKKNILYVAPAVLNLDALRLEYNTPPYFGYQFTKQYLSWAIEGHIFKDQVLPTIRFQVVLTTL